MLIHAHVGVGIHPRYGAKHIRFCTEGKTISSHSLLVFMIHLPRQSTTYKYMYMYCICMYMCIHE